MLFAHGIAIDMDLYMRTRIGTSQTIDSDEQTSIPGLIKGLLDDARDLIREELQLARAEIREEISALQAVTIAFAVAAVVGLLGAMLLSVMKPGEEVSREHRFNEPNGATPCRFAEAQARGEWWKAFGDPVLNALVDRANTANTSIQEAAARLAQARAIARIMVRTFSTHCAGLTSGGGSPRKPSITHHRYTSKASVPGRASAFLACSQNRHARWLLPPYRATSSMDDSHRDAHDPGASRMKISSSQQARA